MHILYIPSSFPPYFFITLSILLLPRVYTPYFFSLVRDRSKRLKKNIGLDYRAVKASPSEEGIRKGQIGLLDREEEKGHEKERRGAKAGEGIYSRQLSVQCGSTLR